MRVTESLAQQQSIALLQKNLETLMKLQEQMATGKRINRPSDDPTGQSEILGFNAMQNNIDQYLRNLDSVETYQKITDSALSTASDTLNAVKHLALAQSSGTALDPATASSQLQKNFNLLLQTANTTFNGQYLFSGYKTDTPAYDASGVYQGDAGVTSVQAGASVTIARNVPGQDAFGSATSGVDIFALLTNLKTAIDSNDQAGIQSLLPQLDQAKDQITVARGEVGVRLQAVQTNRDSLNTLSSNVTQLASDRQSVDLNAVILKFQLQQTTLQATQEASARILQTSLLDFLK